MEFTRGNILRADTEAIMNTVNCVGFMGRGIAAQLQPPHRTFLKERPATLERFARFAKLVECLETLFGMELLAAVHWVMAHERARDRGVVDAIHAWDPRKQVFTDQQIFVAAKRLSDGGRLEGVQT